MPECSFQHFASPCFVLLQEHLGDNKPWRVAPNKHNKRGEEEYSVLGYGVLVGAVWEDGGVNARKGDGQRVSNRRRNR